MRRSGFGLALALCAALFVSREASAAEEIGVIVVRAPHAGKVVEEATVRLAGELRAVGFSVRSLEGAPGVDGRAQIEGADGVFAAIVILETDRGAVADAWIADHATKETLVRRVELGVPGASNAASDLAVRSAELLRASLLELSGEQRRELPARVAQWIADAAAPARREAIALDAALLQPRAAVAPADRATAASGAAAPAGGSRAARGSAAPGRLDPRSAAPRAPTAPTSDERRLSVEAGLAAFAGDVGVVPGPYFRVGYDLAAGVSLRGTLVPAVMARNLDAPGGRVALRQTAAMIGLAYAAGPEAWRIHPVISLGAGVYHVTVAGRANPPYRDRRQDWLTAGVSAGAGLGARVLPYLAAHAALDVLVLARQPVFTIAGVEVGRTGRPALLPSLGLQVSF
ncbi:hypothetical protein [Sorangium atrum]|uniref:Secreted protein n=1 Tax=Sorangium atrum TaxID=2995308 RepID=A0ABT5CIJ5_9BACT|nr:hypothetical protein [Sorangium aterium]MDC0685660.1 hypothetical protein [Sorangium aterium]